MTVIRAMYSSGGQLSVVHSMQSLSQVTVKSPAWATPATRSSVILRPSSIPLSLRCLTLPPPRMLQPFLDPSKHTTFATCGQGYELTAAPAPLAKPSPRHRQSEDKRAIPLWDSPRHSSAYAGNPTLWSASAGWRSRPIRPGRYRAALCSPAPAQTWQPRNPPRRRR